MSSGNQGSFDYGEPYRIPRQRQNEDYNQRRPPDPTLGLQGYPFPPGNPYASMYGPIPGGVPTPNPSMYNTRSGPPVPPRFPYDPRCRVPVPMQPDWTSLGAVGPVNSSPSPYSGYNNNNNNYPNAVNDWTHYHQSAWRHQAPPPPPPNTSYNYAQPQVSQQTTSAYLPPVPKPPLPVEPVPPVTDNKRAEPPASATNDEKDEEKDTKKPVPIMVGKRRGGKALPTGVVKKPRTGNTTQGRTDAWGQYMAEVKKYKEQSCEEERKNRPLVK